MHTTTGYYHSWVSETCGYNYTNQLTSIMNVTITSKGMYINLMYITLMHITILNLHTRMSNIQYLYDDLLLPQSPMLQLHFDDLHLLLYLIQHISIITYQSYHDYLNCIQWLHKACLTYYSNYNQDHTCITTTYRHITRVQNHIHTILARFQSSMHDHINYTNHDLMHDNKNHLTWIL